MLTMDIRSLENCSIQRCDVMLTNIKTANFNSVTVINIFGLYTNE